MLWQNGAADVADSSVVDAAAVASVEVDQLAVRGSFLCGLVVVWLALAPLMSVLKGVFAVGQ